MLLFFAHDPDIGIFGTDVSERLVGWEKLKELMLAQFKATESTQIISFDRVIHMHKTRQVA